MRRASHRRPPRKAARQQAGYMLVMLMLAVAVMSIMALHVAQSYRHRIQRDREVEMIHRGVQYARAVKRYYRKFGAYPTSIDQLEATNQIRFLRKRYKDPMTADGQWKIAHLNDIQLPGVSGLMATPTATTSESSSTSTKKSEGSATATGTKSTSESEATDKDDSSSKSVFGGEVVGPMLGVVSKSDEIGIHSFNDKSRYNEWYFIYAPVQDRGQLITGPFNPSLTGMAVAGTPVTGQKSSAKPGATTTTSPGKPPSKSPHSPRH